MGNPKIKYLQSMISKVAFYCSFGILGHTGFLLIRQLVGLVTPSPIASFCTIYKRLQRP